MSYSNMAIRVVRFYMTNKGIIIHINLLQISLYFNHNQIDYNDNIPLTVSFVKSSPNSYSVLKKKDMESLTKMILNPIEPQITIVQYILYDKL